MPTQPHAKRTAAANWLHRETDSLLESIGHYTRFVFFGKLGLAGLSALLILTIIIIPIINSREGGQRLSFSGVGKTKDDGFPVMTNPRYQGVDNQNQPYTVTAKSATQRDAHTVILDTLQADINLKDGAWMNLNAATGTLDTQAKTLALRGGVELYQDEGYQVKTEAADLHLATKDAAGDLPVDVQGPMGHLQAEGFRIEGNNQILRFIGPVKLTFIAQGGK